MHSIKCTCVRASVIFCSLIVLLGPAALAEKDFYELLGVQRDANSADIRRAFKKVALKMHPDKNADDPDAHAKFLRINRAYEVLKDTEMRRKYDMHGEQGLENNGPQQQYQSWNYYQQDFGLYDDDPDIVTLSASDFDLLVTGSSDVWFINFYSPGCPPCHRLAPVWRETARELGGVIRIGAVNCFEDGNVCGSQGVNRYPWVMLYNPQRQGRFTGPRETESFVSYVLGQLSSSTVDLDESNFDDQVVGSKQSWLVHFCAAADDADCLSPQTLLKLSIMLKTLVSVGVVHCERSEKLCIGQKMVAGGTKFFKVTGETTDIVSLDAKELASMAISQLPAPQVFTEKSFALAKSRVTAEPLLVLLGRAESLKADQELKKLPSLVSDMKVGVLDCDVMRTVCEEEHLPREGVALIKRRGKEFFYGRRVAFDITAFARDSAKSSVRALGPDDFPHPVVNSRVPWFVDFFAPWCPPCQKLLPEFRKAAEGLPEVNFGTVDCTIHQNLCRNYNVRSYPTTLIYNQSTPHLFSGQHAAHAIVEFAEDILRPTAIDFTPSGFDETVGKRSSDVLFLVDFYSPNCGPCIQLAPTWNKLAKLFKDMKQVKVGKVDCIKYRSLCQREGVQAYPSMRAYPRHHTGTSYFHSYNGWHNLQSLRAWAYDFLPKITEELTADNFHEKVIERHDRPYVVDFYAGPWCGPCTMFTPEFELAARQLKDYKVGFGKLNCDHHRRTCEEAGIFQYPSVKLYDGSWRAPNSGLIINSQNGMQIAAIVQQNVELHPKNEKISQAHEEL